jgi:nicotinamide-nucleotide amidase
MAASQSAPAAICSDKGDVGSGFGRPRFAVRQLRRSLRPVIIEIVNTGSELLLGRVLNTHQQWLCRQLADAGYTVNRQVAVPDAGESIQEAVREALGRADLVITTGGLGPTSDDRTRDLIAQLLGRELHFDPAVDAQIRRYFESRGRPVPPRTKVEAMIPAGAAVLANQFGTAPGLSLDVPAGRFRAERSRLVMLPGPPRELRPMFSDQVLPLVQREFPLPGEFICRTLKTTGIGESMMEDRIDGPLRGLVEGGMELGYCARVGEVDVRFVARGARAAAVVAEAERITRELAGEFIFGEQDDTLESVVVREMAERRLTLALAESCTGGHIANRVTNVPGASAILLAGYVSYANSAKISALGVPEQLLRDHGAVSEPVARAMAEGARRSAGSDFALAVTGIAGPAGGTPTKPVGTVHFAMASARGTEAWAQRNVFDRETFKYITAQQGLARLLRVVRARG